MEHYPENIVISSSCRIGDNQVSVNNILKFSQPQAENPGLFLKSVYKQFNIGYPKFYKMDILTRLGFLTAEILLMDKKLMDRYLPEEIGVVIANRSSSIDIDRSFQATIEDDENYFPSPALFVYTLPNIMTGEICIRNGFKGENVIFIQPTFSMEFIQDYVSLLFQMKKLKVCITGWVEADGNTYDSLLLLVEETVSGSRDFSMPFVTSSIKELF
ncbi:MAG: 3-oxoacyl-ACP synthase [Bacteroidetes bacterium]|nr:3-oxoacyl-ACP synthase [Bacteroidota bacterium]